MHGFDRQQMVSALILAVIALFVSAGGPFPARWRRGLRLTAIILFVICLAAVLAEIAFWWIGWDL
ncbi:MAG TPA: hypothetical protein VGS13_02240 [Stellaceae bacterium]|nr:hypothetical protein [Stellaceae bacterium]